MKHGIYIIWGGEAAKKFDKKGEIVMNENVRLYEFDSAKELKAFTLGVDACQGWDDNVKIPQELAEIKGNKIRYKK
jgi:hypothetical protein